MQYPSSSSTYDLFAVSHCIVRFQKIRRLLRGLEVGSTAEQDRSRPVVGRGQRQHGRTGAGGVGPHSMDHVRQGVLFLLLVVQHRGSPVSLHENFPGWKKPCERVEVGGKSVGEQRRSDGCA